MKRLLYFIVLIPTLSFGQRINSTEKAGNGNVYNDSLKRLVKFISRGEEPHDTTYIQYDDFLTDSLRGDTETTKVQFLGIEEIEQKVLTDTSLILYRIFPLSMSGSNFFVNIVTFRVLREQGGLVFINVGKFRIWYSFDCSKAELRYKEFIAIDH